MNIKQAKERYTIEKLLSILGHEPDAKKSKPGDLWYHSPFRPGEKDPSFHIDLRNDFFKDFGASEKGGDLIHFVKLYLRSRALADSTSDALAWLDQLDGSSSSQATRLKTRLKSKPRPVIKEEPYKILSVKKIFSDPLLTYLDQRQISRAIAHRYLKQVHYQRQDTHKKMYGLGHQMRSGGYDIRNTFGFKTTIGPKDITIIKGHQSGGAIEIYEGVMDFLTRLTIDKTPQPEHDTIILNSTNLYETASDHIRNGIYSKVVLWFDNDNAGNQCQNALIEQFVAYENRPVKINTMNHIYKGFKDLNEWHIATILTTENKKGKVKYQT